MTAGGGSRGMQPMSGWVIGHPGGGEMELPEGEMVLYCFVTKLQKEQKHFCPCSLSWFVFHPSRWENNCYLQNEKARRKKSEYDFGPLRDK